MAERTEYTDGTFCWVDLGTSDTDGAKKFYGELFGWTFNDSPAGPDTVYSMIQKKGKDAGALYNLCGEMKEAGVPPHWLSYVSVASADEAAVKAKELGGTIAAEPFDVFDVGRMALIQDPTGARFAVWQSKAHYGASVVNEPGSFCWNELLTNNVDQAGKFYTELFGWSANTQDMGDFQYTVFMNGDKHAGGMMAITEQMGPVPPNWLVYFAVDNCDTAAEKIKTLGGRIVVPATDIPDVGRFAVAMDPQQAAFAVMKLDNPVG